MAGQVQTAQVPTNSQAKMFVTAPSVLK